MTNWKKIYTGTTLDQYIPEGYGDDLSPSCIISHFNGYILRYSLYHNHTLKLEHACSPSTMRYTAVNTQHLLNKLIKQYLIIQI